MDSGQNSHSEPQGVTEGLSNRVLILLLWKFSPGDEHRSEGGKQGLEQDSYETTPEWCYWWSGSRQSFLGSWRLLQGTERKMYTIGKVAGTHLE